MKKYAIVFLFLGIILLTVYFCIGKYTIESDETTYTKKSQLEEVLYENKADMEKLILGIVNTTKELYDNSYNKVDIYNFELDCIDQYLSDNNVYVKENEALLREFYKKSKMDYISRTSSNRFYISQKKNNEKPINLMLKCTINENNSFDWEIVNVNRSDRLYIWIYNLVYN